MSICRLRSTQWVTISSVRICPPAYSFRPNGNPSISSKKFVSYSWQLTQGPCNVTKAVRWLSSHNCLTHCGLVTPYGDIDLSQDWFKSLVAWGHQGQTDVDLSLVRSNDFHLRAISQEIPHLLITRISLKSFIWNFIRVSQVPICLCDDNICYVCNCYFIVTFRFKHGVLHHVLNQVANNAMIITAQ